MDLPTATELDRGNLEALLMQIADALDFQGARLAKIETELSAIGAKVAEYEPLIQTAQARLGKRGIRRTFTPNPPPDLGETKGGNNLPW